MSVYYTSEKLKANCRILAPAGRLQMGVPGLHTALFPHDHVLGDDDGDEDGDDNDENLISCAVSMYLIL